MEAVEEKLGAARLSIFVNAALIAVKLGVALYTGSLGIIAEFAHSFFDLLASALAWVGIKKASEPADEDHHYGHERFENISGLAQALLITLTSLLILYEAYWKLAGGSHVVRESLVGIAAMVATVAVDVKFSRFLHRKSERTGSPALEADAYHFTTDILSTLAVILGLAATALGYPIADILGAVFVALVMISLSVGLGRKAVHVMLDTAPDDKTVERITAAITGHPKVRGYHSIRARTAGNRIFVDVSVHLPADMTLREAHRIAEELEAGIIKESPKVKEVVIHTEPETTHG